MPEATLNKLPRTDALDAQGQLLVVNGSIEFKSSGYRNCYELGSVVRGGPPAVTGPMSAHGRRQKTFGGPVFHGNVLPEDLDQS